MMLAINRGSSQNAFGQSFILTRGEYGNAKLLNINCWIQSCTILTGRIWRISSDPANKKHKILFLSSVSKDREGGIQAIFISNLHWWVEGCR